MKNWVQIPSTYIKPDIPISVIPTPSQWDGRQRAKFLKDSWPEHLTYNSIDNKRLCLKQSGKQRSIPEVILQLPCSSALFTHRGISHKHMYIQYTNTYTQVFFKLQQKVLVANYQYHSTYVLESQAKFNENKVIFQSPVYCDYLVKNKWEWW